MASMEFQKSHSIKQKIHTKDPLQNPTPFTHLLEDLVLLPPSPLFQLSLAALLSFADTPLALSQHAEGVDTTFLLQPNELLGEEVERVANAAALYLG